METKQTINSNAEIKAKTCLDYSFCKSLNLQNIKDTLATMLNHIGDNGMFAEYTMHDISHVNGMLELLDKIIPSRTKDIMTPADWLMIVLAIYFHDLGMHIPQGEYENRTKNTEYRSFKKNKLSDEGIKSYYDELGNDAGEKFLYQEYVRKNHGKRIYEWITNSEKKVTEPYKMIDDMLGGLDTSFRSDLALICQSHQLDELPEHLKSVDEAYGSSLNEKVNLLYVSTLLRSADILHMTHDRTPDIEYRIISPQNSISIIEWAKQKAVRSVDVLYQKDENGKVDKTKQPYMFEIQAKFTDDKGYFSFKEYLTYVKQELKRCHAWCEESRNNNSNDYIFPWTGVDTSRVQAEGFSKNKLKFEIDQESILKLLTGHTLYNDSTVVLRELIQNAMDAGKLQDGKSKDGSDYQFKLEISWDSKQRVLRVADNATGMSADDITNYLLKVGASKYQSEAFKKAFPDFHSISRFGIGLLTCFMISDEVDIFTLDSDEKQCHLLKIRNLTGEYLMRNDADVSNIIEKEHGTTFMLKVRPEINMDNIEQQIKQWIVIPYGKITLKIDEGQPITIGYSNVKEALESYLPKLKGVDMTSGNYRVIQYTNDELEISILQKFDPVRKVWFLYNYQESEYKLDTPIGLCIEGIRVLSNTPGLKGRIYCVLANCKGMNSPTTNVARNDLEEGALLDKMYHNLYEVYIKSFVSQLDELQKNYSMSWAISEINYLIDSFYNIRHWYLFDRRDILYDVFKKTQCNPIDDGNKIRLYDIEKLPDSVYTFDYRAFNAAFSLLMDMKTLDKTAYGLLTELEGKSIKNEQILLHNTMAMCNFDLFLNNYEVSDISVDEAVRKIKFKWIKKRGIWKHINTPPNFRSYHIFVLINGDAVSIEGLNNNSAITSGDCVFLIKESPLLALFKELIDNNVNDEVLGLLGNLVGQILMDLVPVNDHNVERYLKAFDDHQKQMLIKEVQPDRLKQVLKDSDTTTININKYYRNY